jgi:hypothetical protein
MSSQSRMFVGGNDHVIQLDELQDHEGAFVNDATVTLDDIFDERTGDTVLGVSFPVAMDYVSGSNGRYEGLVPYTADVTKFRRYVATVTVLATNGRRGSWREYVWVTERKG